MQNRLLIILTALALITPTAPIAAYSEVCMRMPYANRLNVWVEKLNTDEMRAAALEAVERGKISYGTPRVVETRKIEHIELNQTKCVDVSDFLSVGDIFRVRVKNFTDSYSLEPGTCRPNSRKIGEAFWDWPEFYVQNDTSGKINFLYKLEGTFESNWCQMESGEGRWKGCYEGLNLLTPGCWKLAPKSTNGARIYEYLRDDLPPARVIFLLMENRELAGMNARLRGNETPLHLAARLKNKEYIKNLLSFGADQTLADDRGYTPLHTAVEGNLPGSVVWLVGSAKRDGIEDTVLTAKDQRGRTPIHLAVHKALEGDWTRILGMLLEEEGRHVNMTDETGETPLHTATREDRQILVLGLLTAGVDASVPHAKTGETALDMATRLGTLKSAAALMNHNAPRLLTDENDNPADAVDENGQTALHRAAAVDDDAQIRTLLELGADPNIQDNNSDTAMILALKAGHLNPLRYLLTNNGSDSNLAGGGGDTALHWAARQNMHQAVDALIREAGANLNPTNERGETPLDVAALTGGVEAASILILRGASRGVTDESDNPANGKNADGDAPLHLAVMANDPARIEQLAPLNPDVNIRNRRGETPLLLALRLKEAAAQTVDTLLAAGASLTAGDNSGVSPMHRAAEEGVVTALRAGLGQGADVDIRDGNDATPLHWALRNPVLAGSNPAAAFLLEHGANPTLADRNGVVPLHEAAKNGYHQVIDAAVDHPDADLDVRNSEGETPLHWGISGGEEYSVRALLDGGANPSLRDTRFSYTALHWAAKVGNRRAARAVREIYPDVDLDARGGRMNLTPLAMAVVENRHLGFVRVMLELGANPDVDSDGASPLEWAVHNNNALIAEVLLEHEADPNFSARPHTSPALAAAGEGKTKMVRLLAEHGADFSRLSPNNQRPEDLALANGHGDVIQALHDTGRKFPADFIARMRADSRLSQLATDLFGVAYDPALNQKNDSEGKTKLHYAAQYNDLGGVRDLLRRGADPHVRNRDGQTPMMTAIIRGHGGNERIVRVLLEAGTDPEEGDDHGNTPLSWAAKSGQLELALVLLEFGAQADRKIRGKFTALHLAAKSSPELARILVEAGTDVNVPDRRGYTPLHWALDPNNSDHDLVGKIVTELLRLGAETIPDPAGNDPLSLAEDGGHDAAAALLRVRRALRGN